MAFLAVGVGAYALCGMPVFDAVLHTMGALSTGGFSNQAESIGAYHSVAIEGVTVVLMLVGTTTSPSCCSSSGGNGGTPSGAASFASSAFCWRSLCPSRRWF